MLIRHEQRGDSLHFYGGTPKDCENAVSGFNERFKSKGFCLKMQGTFLNIQDGTWIGIATLQRL